MFYFPILTLNLMFFRNQTKLFFAVNPKQVFLIEFTALTATIVERHLKVTPITQPQYVTSWKYNVLVEKSL